MSVHAPAICRCHKPAWLHDPAYVVYRQALNQVGLPSIPQCRSVCRWPYFTPVRVHDGGSVAVPRV